MEVAAPAGLQWTVSTRNDGEVLTIWSGGDDLRIGLLATPGSFTAAEYEGWLTDLVGVARETSRTAPEPGPIPRLLHQALSGLLFSHGELWERAGGAHCSIALVSSGTEIGIGWVGGVDIEIRIDGESRDVAWVTVRDADGREARAARFDARQAIHVELTWLPTADAVSSVVIGAQWPGVAGAGNSPATSRLAVSAPQPTTEPRATPARLEPSEPSRDEIIIEMAADPSPAAPDPPLIDVTETLPRHAGWSGLWAWLTGRGRRPARRRTGGEDPPWVDVGGLAATENNDESSYQSLEPNLRALGPASPGLAAPHLGSPQFETLNPSLATALPEMPGEKQLPGSAAPVAAPVLRMPEPEKDAAPLDPHVAALESSSAPLEPPVVDRSDLAAVTEPPPAVRTSPPRPSLAAPAFETPEPAGHEVAAPRPQGIAPLSEPSHPAPHRAQLGPDWAEPIDVAPAATFRSEARTGVPRRPQWPSAAELEAPTPLWKRRWVWGVAIAILFGVGWMVGGMQNDHTSAPTAANPFTRALHAVGLGGARFDCLIESRPPGAWITVDGKPLVRRTPASVELKPGTHVVGLSLAELGGASVTVHGARGDQVSLDEPLWGSLVIEQVDPGIPVTVAVDGRELGYVPAMVDSLMPGAHEVRFSGPGMTPWAQTVQVRVRQAEHLTAHPMTSPKTGVLVVSATRNDETGSAPLAGGEVWIDGQPRGQTPLTLELPRGPHSVRVAARGESAPVQVIDLPGGNQRFATFELGVGSDGPRLTPVLIADHVAADRPTLVSATLSGVSVSEIREMWLHVRGPDGPWRRYALDVMKTAGGAVGVTVFPLGVFDADGRTQYYLSALTSTGDEYFTEMAPAQIAAPAQSATPAR